MHNCICYSKLILWSYSFRKGFKCESYIRNLRKKRKASDWKWQFCDSISFIGNESTKECIMRMSFVVLRLLLIVGTKQTQIQKACFQTPERLIHNDFKLFLSGFPPVSCYWLIARDQGATWGKQNFHRWFIYPLHHLSTLSSRLRNLKCPQAPTLSPQGHSVDSAAKTIWLWFKKQW